MDKPKFGLLRNVGTDKENRDLQESLEDYSLEQFKELSFKDCPKLVLS